MAFWKRETDLDRDLRMHSEGVRDSRKFDAHDRAVANGTAPTHCGQVAEHIGDGTHACVDCHAMF